MNDKALYDLEGLVMERAQLWPGAEKFLEDIVEIVRISFEAGKESVVPAQGQPDNSKQLALATKLDFARHWRIVHGVRVDLDYLEMDLARDALRAVVLAETLAMSADPWDEHGEDIRHLDQLLHGGDIDAVSGTADDQGLFADPAEQPPTDDLEDLVARFSKALLAKLKLARANGRSGWEQDDWEGHCQQGLLRHVEKGDPRDVAAYCAFMWHHGWTTKAASQSPAETAPQEPTEALKLIKDRLDDLRSANDVLQKQSALGSRDLSNDIRRNEREIRWLVNINTVLRSPSQPETTEILKLRAQVEMAALGFKEIIGLLEYCEPPERAAAATGIARAISLELSSTVRRND